MEKSYYHTKIVSLNKNELENINGGGTVWEWLGKVTGNVKNAAVSCYENWLEMPATPF